MKIKIIAATGKNNELGNKGGLPFWNLKTDFARFRKLTEGSIVVMGQRTFESLPEKFRPLPNRKNIVLTQDKNFNNSSIEIFYSIPELLQHFSTPEPKAAGVLWIMGGASIYKQFIDQADELHITHVDGEFEADVFFPTIDPNIWQKTIEEKVPASEKDSHPTTYTVYERRA